MSLAPPKCPLGLGPRSPSADNHCSGGGQALLPLSPSHRFLLLAHTIVCIRKNIWLFFKRIAHMRSSTHLKLVPAPRPLLSKSPKLFPCVRSPLCPYVTRPLQQPWTQMPTPLLLETLSALTVPTSHSVVSVLSPTVPSPPLLDPLPLVSLWIYHVLQPCPSPPSCLYRSPRRTSQGLKACC